VKPYPDSVQQFTLLDATAISRDPAVVEAYGNDPLVHSLGTPRREPVLFDRLAPLC